MVILSDKDAAPRIPALIKSPKAPKSWINNEKSQLNVLTQKNLLIRVNTRSGVQNNTSQSEAETNTTDVASAAEEPVEVKPEAQWKFVYKDELGLRAQTNNVPVTLTTSDGTVTTGKLHNLPSITKPEDNKIQLSIYPDEVIQSDVVQVAISEDGDIGQYLISTPDIELEYVSDNDKIFRLRAEANTAMILLPSLTTPALQTQDAPLTFILAVTQRFHETAEKEKVDSKIGVMTLRRLHRQLIIKPYEDIQEEKYTGITDKTPHRFYPDEQLTPDFLKDNIQCECLGEFDGQEDMPISIPKPDDSGSRLIGILDSASLKNYKEAGYTHIYYVQFSNLNLEKGLHNIEWLCPKDLNIESKKYPFDKSFEYYEPQDFFQNNWHNSLSNHKDRSHDKKLGDIPYQKLYTPNTNDSFNGFNDDNGPLLQSVHPVFVGPDRRLNPGQLSDVHVSSRQHLFHLSPAQVIPGADAKYSPIIGDISQRNLDSLQKLMDKMGKDKDVDILIITGDLQDHTINADPASPCNNKKMSKASDLWEVMNHKHHNDAERYPRNLDMLMILSLMHQFMHEHGKPILFIDGNHEAYDLPYGISPRGTKDIAQAKDISLLHNIRANAGIPGDHNLTIYEATLLYGPTYGHYHQIHNFTAANQDWARMTISPWKDWVIQYGKQQTWIGLSWGRDEEFLGSIAANGGALPRANEACNDTQLKLIENAVDLGSTQNLLLSHFTYVNYSLERPLNDNDSRVNIKGTHRNQYDEGSFHHNRATIYHDYIGTGKIHYTFSGHSHRTGIYTIEENSNFFKTTKVKTNGYHPDNYKATPKANYDPKSNENSPVSIIVAGSGGPMSFQNRDGEYLGQGAEVAQGLTVDTTKDIITVVKNDNDRAPRMAVLLDYLWYEHGLPLLTAPSLQHGFEHCLGLNLEAGTITLNLTKEWVAASMHGGQLLNVLCLHMYDNEAEEKDKYVGYVGFKKHTFVSVNGAQNCVYNYEAIEGSLSVRELQKQLEQSDESDENDREDFSSFLFFLSIQFQDQIKKKPHNHYDYKSPWCFPVEFQETDTIQKEWETKRNKLAHKDKNTFKEDKMLSKLQKSTSNYFIWRANGNESDVPDFKNSIIRKIYGKL